MERAECCARLDGRLGSEHARACEQPDEELHRPDFLWATRTQPKRFIRCLNNVQHTCCPPLLFLRSESIMYTTSSMYASACKDGRWVPKTQGGAATRKSPAAAHSHTVANFFEAKRHFSSFLRQILGKRFYEYRKLHYSNFAYFALITGSKNYSLDKRCRTHTRTQKKRCACGNGGNF